MSRNVTVGLDGSPESRAAAEWAAREAKLRGLPLRLVHVWEPVPEPMAQASLLGAETQAHWSERVPRETAEGLRLRHPGVHVETEQIPGRPADALAGAAKAAELLVLGSRGLSGIAGFLVGSVGMAVIADTETPVVLVRAGEQGADEHEADPAGIPSAATAYRPVVLGLDTGHPHDTVIAFAFEEAARRGTSLRVVHGWNLPPYSAYGLPADLELNAELGRQEAAALTEVLRPWRQVPGRRGRRGVPVRKPCPPRHRRLPRRIAGRRRPPDPPQPDRRPHRIRHARGTAPRHRPRRRRRARLNAPLKEWRS